MSEFVLLFTDDFEGARGEIEALGGRVTQKFTDRVFEAVLPEDAGPQALRLSSPTKPADLDDVSTLMAAAWSKRGAKTKKGLKGLTGSAQAIAWDTKGYQPPRNEDNDPALRRPSSKKKGLTAESTGTPTSLYMTGTVAVGLVVVSGTGAGLGFSGAEQTKVISEVMEGLQFLTGAEPAANLNFIYSIQFVTINAAAPTTPCPSYEACESIWRDPALQSLGYAAGLAGCQAYVNKLKQQTGSDWSYVAFFTKYPQYHFAYAYGPVLCMQYANDGWGPDRINQVFAHETCHIFGAADEYGTCVCGNSGTFNVPNSNCVNCTSSQVPCLMNANTLSLCAWSRGQIGWSTWAQMPGGLKNVSAAADGTVWGVNSADNIYKYVGGSSVWQQMPGALVRVSAGSAANVWGVNSTGNIYKYVGGSTVWQQIAGGLIDVDVAADGTVWGVNSAGNIYKYVGGAAVWQQVPGGLRRISVGSAGIVWGVNSVGNIYKYVGGSAGWQLIPGALTEIGAAADGTVWGVNSAGNIYKYVGGSAAWQQISGGLTQISVGGASVIWGVNSAGNIYRRLVGAT
jgi:hypothetical protein